MSLLSKLELPETKQKILILLLIFLAVLLNQSSVIGGVNMSFADIFAFIFMASLIYYNYKISVPKLELSYFIFLTFNIILTPLFIVPVIFDYQPDPILIFREYIKISALFFYLTLGFNIQKLHQEKILLKYFSAGVLILSLISVISSFGGLGFLRPFIYWGSLRFKGLMNDPNYFSVLQLCGLAYYWRITDLNRSLRFTAILLIIFSVLDSGSKTGFIVMFLYFSFMFFEYLIKTPINIKKTISLFLLLFITPICILFVFSDYFLSVIAEHLPVFNRVIILLNDLDEGVSGGGSGRAEAWSIATNLINKSPVLGIGVGTYSSLGRIYYGSGVIAHNTYLQIAVEWGLFFASIFLFYLAVKIYEISIKKNCNLSVLIYRDIIIILLLGSLAISLNNARLFWISLGVILYKLKPLYNKLANQE